MVDAFLVSRLGPEAGAFGMLPPGCKLDDIVERASPAHT